MWRVLLSVGLVCEASVSCKNEDNMDVDWFIVYKAPVCSHQHLTGLEYIYIDSTGKKVMSGPLHKRINDTNGVLANTLWPMFTPDPKISFLSYNDQPPGGTRVPCTYGHSKGVVLGERESDTALWLTHSTPQFPYSKDMRQFYPRSGVRNGQTFMCVSVRFSDLQTVGKHLQNIRAFTFRHKNTDSFPKELMDASKNSAQVVPSSNFQTLTTRGKYKLNIMAKRTGGTSADGDLYVQLARGFGGAVYAKTWGCQKGRDQSYCKGAANTHVINAEDIQTDLGEWSWGKDHSKWAVTATEDLHWTCISDMNRAPSQYQRWGGALCIRDKSVHSYFKGFVANTPKCNKPPEPLKRPRLELEECNEDEECKEEPSSSLVKKVVNLAL